MIVPVVGLFFVILIFEKSAPIPLMFMQSIDHRQRRWVLKVDGHVGHHFYLWKNRRMKKKKEIVEFQTVREILFLCFLFSLLLQPTWNQIFSQSIFFRWKKIKRKTTSNNRSVCTLCVCVCRARKRRLHNGLNCYDSRHKTTFKKKKKKMSWDFVKMVVMPSRSDKPSRLDGRFQTLLLHHWPTDHLLEPFKSIRQIVTVVLDSHRRIGSKQHCPVDKLSAVSIYCNLITMVINR